MSNNKVPAKKTAASPATGAKKSTENAAPKNDYTFAFSIVNYILMLLGIIVMGVGYILLAGGGSDDPNVFNYDMFDNRRLVAAPVTIMVGIIIEIVAIMLRPFGKKKD
ncbi:MAG: DUF3098 domain-containing protein [Bacteroidales bacterium]|nr:DUF3098 domain-containing protein [Bacteroidales bacterium]